MNNRQTVYYGTGVSKLELCGKTIGWYLNTSGAFEAPYETKPTTGKHDYTTCKNCQRNLKEITTILTERFEGTADKESFPHCCIYHTNLIKIKEYRRADFTNAPELTAKKVVYTQQHIENNHKSNDYYKEITDYIEYTVNSFGQMPEGCGEPLYASYYLSAIKQAISNDKDIQKAKRKALLDYIEKNYESEKTEKTEKRTDLNILLNTYQNWLNIFPFEISFFRNLKNHFEKTLPFLSGKPEVNKYTGIATAKIHTKSSLVDTLINLTNSLITQLNSHSLYEKGLLNEPDKLKLELILNERKLKLKQGYINKSQNEEQRYRKILKAWFTDEKAFINSIVPIMKTLPQPQPKVNKEPDRLKMAKGAVITNKWANGEIAEMKYNSAEIWHQVAGYHYRGDTLYKNHPDHELDTVNFPVITKGLTAFLIQNLGKGEQLIFDNYYKNCLNRFKQIEARKPGSSMRNLDSEFYPIHILQEKEFAKFSELIHPYLSEAEIELINQYTGAYFKYIEQVYSPKGVTENTSSSQQETENNFMLATIENWLFPFKEEKILSDANYNNLVTALNQYFENGKFPKLNNQINVNRVNKKRFGWALNEIFRANKNNNESLPIDYLRFAKENISIFEDASFDENNYLKSNLYKYFTTKTQ